MDLVLQTSNAKNTCLEVYVCGGLLCYLPSDVPLVGKRKLNTCPELGAFTLLVGNGNSHLR